MGAFLFNASHGFKGHLHGGKGAYSVGFITHKGKFIYMSSSKFLNSEELGVTILAGSNFNKINLPSYKFGKLLSDDFLTDYGRTKLKTYFKGDDHYKWTNFDGSPGAGRITFLNIVAVNTAILDMGSAPILRLSGTLNTVNLANTINTVAGNPANVDPRISYSLDILGIGLGLEGVIKGTPGIYSNIYKANNGIGTL